MSDTIPVVVGLLRRRDGMILLCRRSVYKPYPLEWEFPGGKVEGIETRHEALVRELREELGIEAVVGPLLHQQHADYGDGGRFLVRYYLIEQWEPDPVNRDFHEIRWVMAADIPGMRLLHGNARFVEKLLTLGIEAMANSTQ